jgi:hypothetical protein
MEVGGLEAKWEQQFAEDSNDTMNEDGGKSTSNHVHPSGSAVHMELFYDAEESSYSGPVHDAHGRNNVGYAC